MNDKKTILVDLDGVMADLVSAWLEAYAKNGGETIHPYDVLTYDFGKAVKQPKLFHSLLDKCRLFKGLIPFGDVSGFKALCEAHDVFIVTHVHADSAYGHGDKVGWISSMFPWFDRSRIIFAKHKYLVQGDILIEDSSENLDAWTQANPKGIGICISAPYNRDWHPVNSTRMLRADDISHAEKMIRRFL